MKKRPIIVLSFLGLIFLIMACNLPYKIVRNYTSTPQPTTSSTASQTKTPLPIESVSETPTIETPQIILDEHPIAGSVLTWLDYTNFVYIPSGDYALGKDSANLPDYAPMHTVSLNAFWIQRSEVTNQQYSQCVSTGVCSPPAKDPEVPYWFEDPYSANHPVVGVTWFQANEYCSSIQARLPTEAEWEAAARGVESKIYPWGADQPNCNYLNFNGCLEPSEPTDILSYPFGVSEFGVMDLAGNAFEWVNDWYDKAYFAASPGSNPTGPTNGSKKVFRGGSYKSSKNEIGSYLRFAIEPEKQSSDLGFRCILLGDPTIDSQLKIGQPCKVAGINVPMFTQATKTPFPCSDASVSGYCELLNGKPSYGLVFVQTGCLQNGLNSMTANFHPLTCVDFDLSGGGKSYRCTFPGMAQGINVKINYCHTLDLPNVKMTCPTGYDLVSNHCELTFGQLPTPPCPNGYHNIEGAGCLPVLEYESEGCPIGFYSTGTTTSTFCFPLDQCALPGNAEKCANQTCGMFEKFDATKGCCEAPDLPKKLCPANFIYDFGLEMCVAPDLYSTKCLSVETKIPYCPTLTPTNTPIPPKEPQGCSSYKDMTSCQANGCNWSPGFHNCY